MGREKWRSRRSDREEGTNDESECVITNVGTNLKTFKALSKLKFGSESVARMADVIGAGVAKTIWSKGPKVEVDDCNIYREGFPETRVMGVET